VTTREAALPGRIRNGPRYWLMNQLEKQQRGPQIVKRFGGLRMIEEATLPLTGLSTKPFTIHQVNRSTTCSYTPARPSTSYAHPIEPSG
jgi:hypothetical protein